MCQTRPTEAKETYNKAKETHNRGKNRPIAGVPHEQCCCTLGLPWLLLLLLLLLLLKGLANKGELAVAVDRR
jgi:hypothetical protein